MCLYFLISILKHTTFSLQIWSQFLVAMEIDIHYRTNNSFEDINEYFVVIHYEEREREIQLEQFFSNHFSSDKNG